MTTFTIQNNNSNNNNNLLFIHTLLIANNSQEVRAVSSLQTTHPISHDLIHKIHVCYAKYGLAAQMVRVKPNK